MGQYACHLLNQGNCYAALSTPAWLEKNSTSELTELSAEFMCL
jgi:hypothetical protein